MAKKYLLFLIVTIIVISGCSQKTTENKTTPSEVKENIINIKDFSFQPSELTINTRETITWIQQDSVAHTVVSSGLFQSNPLSTGEEFTFTFTKPGTYNYNCGIHPSMKGKIIVK